MPASTTIAGADKTQDSYARQLETFEALRRPLIMEALAWLALSPGSHGLDAGCGVGQHLELLLKAISPGGRVTGLDLSPDLLARAGELVKAKGIADAVKLAQGDIYGLPFEPASFDWIWSLDCAGYMPGAKAAQLAELTRVIKPGGRLALMAYSSQQLLAGYPGLEARLGATRTGQAPFKPGDAPGDHFLRLPERLGQAGLLAIEAQSFLAEFRAPLDPLIKQALLELMDMRWGAARAEVSVADWELFTRLTRPDSPDCVLDTPGYYGFFTYTVFTGQKPA